MIPPRVTSPCLDMELIINDMERKIGEIFECNGLKLRVEAESSSCIGCYFDNSESFFCSSNRAIRCECQSESRSDGGVIFKKVEDMEEENKQSILDEAKAIVEGSRQSDYGDAVNNFERIAAIVNSVYPELNITSQQCCMVLIAVKLIREGYRHKRDNLVDLCGYAEIMNEIQNLEKKGE